MVNLPEGEPAIDVTVTVPDFQRFVRYAELSPEERQRREQIGQFWRTIRIESKRTRPKIANLMGIKPSELALFERGLSETIVSHGDLPMRYASALGKPELYDLFCEQFGIPKLPPPLQ